jgi:hypothetical protein
MTDGHEARKGITMCKPGSASSGSGVASTGLGLPVVVLAAAGAVSMAGAVISTFLTAVLVTLIGVAAVGSIMLAVLLYRTRGAATRSASRPPATGRQAPLVQGPIQPARSRPAVGAAARAAIPARQPLAIEAPAPLPARLSVPAGSGDLAMARLTADWLGDLVAGWPGDVDGRPAPGLLPPAGIRLAPAAPAEDVVTTR